MNWSKLVQKNLVSNTNHLDISDNQQNNSDSNIVENNIDNTDIYDNLIRPYIFDSCYDI